MTNRQGDRRKEFHDGNHSRDLLKKLPCSRLGQSTIIHDIVEQLSASILRIHEQFNSRGRENKKNKLAKRKKKSSYYLHDLRNDEVSLSAPLPVPTHGDVLWGSQTHHYHLPRCIYDFVSSKESIQKGIAKWTQLERFGGARRGWIIILFHTIWLYEGAVEAWGIRFHV